MTTRPTLAGPAPVQNAPAPPAPDGRESRAAARLPASAVPSITSVRFSPHGVEATLVNISETGVLVDCAERLKPGTSLTVVFEGGFQPQTIPARVVRVSVSGMNKDGRLRYHVGVAFNSSIALGPATDDTVAAPAVDPPPARRIVQNRW